MPRLREMKADAKRTRKRYYVDISDFKKCLSKSIHFINKFLSASRKQLLAAVYRN